MRHNFHHKIATRKQFATALLWWLLTLIFTMAPPWKIIDNIAQRTLKIQHNGGNHMVLNIQNYKGLLLEYQV